ncbi:ABC transporter ATP-binding protein [Mycolicibacterium sp. 050158]|uniref:ABC transporter ATP-binding protein n=1 Tax=Mycolicibacterium sp. 050158 TaxID=3090602 RepID=UPI00299F27AE|nr:ABC transporter ATP-binding protein [Mycolicibacterium sp. 050158]MDX1891685.1 ABC transporter ATP-binding protein [Mycolicibacterium sp. 050158]
MRIRQASPSVAITKQSSSPAGQFDGVDVRISGVTKRYGDTIAVDDLNLDIEHGEFLSLLGPSGCGKTTTLKLIAGFEQPSEGRIVIGGQPAEGLPPHKRDVNTVFQHYALFPHLSVLDNVAYGLKQRGVKKAVRRHQAAEALELVGLADRAGGRPADLSGGQQQRVALARALVLRPRVLLLDEPLGALDLKLREHMQIELKRIHAEVGLTFVFVTHDQGEALSMSDRIAVMNDGRIEQLATPQEVYDAPGSRFVASFIGDMNQLRADLYGETATLLDGALHAPIAATVEAPAAGQRHVLVGVRPADVSVRSSVEAEAHGRIETAMLTGHEVQLVVVLRDGQRVVAQQDRHRTAADAAHVRTGEHVVLNLAPNSVLLLGAAESDLKENPDA